MARTTQPNENRDAIEETVLDAVQKGFTKVSDLISYSGPELIDVGTGTNTRELDVPQVMRAIERMIQRGDLERLGSRGLDQLEVRLTEQGRANAPQMPERDRELVEKYGIAPNALRVLSRVVEFEETHGSQPSMSQLQSQTDVDLITYQIQPLYTQLVNTNLAKPKGFLRFKIEPTDRGRTAVEEFTDIVE